MSVELILEKVAAVENRNYSIKGTTTKNRVNGLAKNKFKARKLGMVDSGVVTVGSLVNKVRQARENENV